MKLVSRLILFVILTWTAGGALAQDTQPTPTPPATPTPNPTPTMTPPPSPWHVYLTWQRENTDDNITVNYQTWGMGSESSNVYYDIESHNGQGPRAYKNHAKGELHQLEGLMPEREIHWVELKNLDGGRAYFFIAGDDKNGYTQERKFHTIPKDASTLRFVTGGDVGTGEAPTELFKQAALREPDFLAVGGDNFYENGILKNFGILDKYLEMVDETLVTPIGYTIPLFLAIGNHDVLGFGGGNIKRATFWHGYFAQSEEKSYFARTFGKDVVFLALDSGHIFPHAIQKEWIEEQLKENEERPFKFAIYHAPLYPTHRVMEDRLSQLGRDAWGPVFDQYKLTTAFENHDHTFKRTKLIKAGVEDPEGTLYLGDGCMGRGPRPVDLSRLPLHAKAAPIQHFWYVEIDNGKAIYRAVSREGKVFDVYPTDNEEAKAADVVFEKMTEGMANLKDPGE